MLSLALLLAPFQSAVPHWNPGLTFDDVHAATQSGDRVLTEGIGEVVVRVRSGGGWDEEDTLLPGNPIYKLGYTDGFPSSMDLEGDLAVVGASFDDFGRGAAYVYRRNGVDWVEEAKLVPVLFSQGAEDAYGAAAVIAPDGTVLIGCPEDSFNYGGPGYVSIVQQSNTGIWRQKGKLGVAPLQADEFGASLALSGDTLVVGAPGTFPAGAVRVYRGAGLSWNLEATLVPADGGSDDRFGTEVAIDGDRILVSATSQDNALGTNAGAAYVFERSGTTWTETAKLLPGDGGAHEYFGSPIGMHGDLAVAGSFQHDHGGVSKGAVYLFARDSAGWSQVGELLDGDPSSTFSHGSTWIDGDLWVGSIGAESRLTVFEPDGAVSYCTAGTSASGCAATLSASGAASASQASGFVVHAGGVEGTSNGFFFFGVNGRQAKTWGSGSSFHCVNQPTRRAGLMTGAGTPGSCDGTFQQDLNALWCSTCPKSQHNPGPGALVQVQFWYRDPLGSAWPKTGLSDALEALTLP